MEELTFKERAQRSIYTKRVRDKRRAKAIEALGGECVRCGFDDVRALQIDHVHGGGCNDGFSSHQRYRDVILAARAGLDTYQLLCANCNWIKRDENHEIYQGYLKWHVTHI